MKKIKKGVDVFMEKKINELRERLKKRAVEIEGKKYISRVMLKEELGVKYKELKKKTSSKRWKKISKKVDGQIYFEFDLITNEMLENLLKQESQKGQGQKTREQEVKERSAKKEVKKIEEKLEAQENFFVKREELKEILNALISAYQELSFHIGKILWRYYDIDKFSYDKFCDVWEKRYKSLQEIKERLERQN